MSYVSPIAQAATIVGVALPPDPDNFGYDSRWSMFHSVSIAVFGMDLSVEQLCAVFGYAVSMEDNSGLEVSSVIAFADRLVAA